MHQRDWKHVERRKRLILGILGVAILIASALLSFQFYREKHFWEFEETGAPLEEEYLEPGPYQVSFEQYKVPEEGWGSHLVYYPDQIQEEEAWPVIIMTGGTGGSIVEYRSLLKRLSTWGFIVVGTTESISHDGEDADLAADLVLALNKDPKTMLYKKVDTGRIGLAGHGLGGIGALNAVTLQPNGYLYKALFLTSPMGDTSWTEETAREKLDNPEVWDSEKLDIPVFVMAAVINGQYENIIYTIIDHLYDSIPASTPKLAALEKSKSSNENTLYSTAGYRTAWFMYWLQDDKHAGSVFTGSDPEIEQNFHWEGVERSPAMVEGLRDESVTS